MTEFLLNAKASLIYWKMAVVHVVLFVLMTCGGAWIAAISSISAKQWAELPNWDRWKIYVGVSLTAMGTISAFLNRTMAELRKNQNSLPDLGTPATDLSQIGK